MTSDSRSVPANGAEPRLGLRENLAQFSLLVLVNLFVGSMVGLERAILPKIAEQEFHLAKNSAVLSFILVFGIVKALMNYAAGKLSESKGRKFVLVLGWFAALPVPLLLMWAPSWNWILLANVFLGISQGMTWSTTVIMKIDLVGPLRRGLAMGLNEFSGYAGVALSALATGYIAGAYGLRPTPFYPGVAYVVIGVVLSVLVIRDTRAHVGHEAKSGSAAGQSAPAPSGKVKLPALKFIAQAGLVNRLNDGMAWGLFPLLFAEAGLQIGEVGKLAAIYPGVWGVLQLATGPLSDRIGRKRLIAAGMVLQAIGLATTGNSHEFAGFALGAVLLGAGTAMVYPVLTAAVGDIAPASARASAVGAYRFWRDSGYAVGAVVAGVAADALGMHGAVWVVASISATSGLVVAVGLRETLRSVSAPASAVAKAA